MPVVSIVTPCYNTESFIADTIASVQNQTFEDWEHIVVDDGSTDASADIVQRAIDEDPTGRLRLHRQSNQGVSAARNRGLEVASTDSKYILFLDADDCLKPQMLEKMVQHLDRHPAASLAYCLFDKVNSSGEVLDRASPRQRYRSTLWKLHEVDATSHRTPALTAFEGKIIPSVSLIRRAHLGPWDLFDEDLNIQPNEDADAFARIAMSGPIHQVHYSLVRYRIHPSQSTQNQAPDTRTRLLEKWARAWPDLNRRQQRARRKIWLDYHGLVIPKLWIEEARRQRDRESPWRTVLFGLGAIARYVWYAPRRMISHVLFSNAPLDLTEGTSEEGARKAYLVTNLSQNKFL